MTLKQNRDSSLSPVDQLSAGLGRLLGQACQRHYILLTAYVDAQGTPCSILTSKCRDIFPGKLGKMCGRPIQPIGRKQRAEYVRQVR